MVRAERDHLDLVDSQRGLEDVRRGPLLALAHRAELGLDKRHVVAQAVPRPEEVRGVIRSEHGGGVCATRDLLHARHGREPRNALRLREDAEGAESQLVVDTVAEAVDLVGDGDDNRVLVAARHKRDLLLFEGVDEGRGGGGVEVPEPELSGLVRAPRPHVPVVGDHHRVCEAARDAGRRAVLHVGHDARLQLDLRDHVVA
mmetsp:Transcript_26870/g.64116  ORF Transcript_26870/g.64116 Transcript_26870/m.64116 type:complete len:201 (-) Transcript_26870:2433-3035(-)